VSAALAPEPFEEDSMDSIILITFLGCIAVLLLAWLLTRPRLPRCRCGAAALVTIGGQWYCGKHADRHLDRE